MSNSSSNSPNGVLQSLLNPRAEDAELGASTVPNAGETNVVETGPPWRWTPQPSFDVARIVRRVPLQRLGQVDVTLTPPPPTTDEAQGETEHDEDADGTDEASNSRALPARSPPPEVNSSDDDDEIPVLLDVTDSSDSDSDSNAEEATSVDPPRRNPDGEDFPELLDVSDSEEDYDDDSDSDHDLDSFLSNLNDAFSSTGILEGIHRALESVTRRPAQLVAVLNGLTGSLTDDGIFDTKRAEELMRGLEPVSPGLLKRYLRAAGTDAEVMCAVCREDLVVEDDREPLTSIPDLSSPLEMRDRVETPLPTPPSGADPPPPFLQPQPPATSADVLALPCRHAFHAACLHPWLARRTTCPTCRMDLDPESLTLSLVQPAVPVQDGLPQAQGTDEQEPLPPIPAPAIDARELGLLGSPDLPERPLGPTPERELSVPPDVRANAATPPLQEIVSLTASHSSYLREESSSPDTIHIELPTPSLPIPEREPSESRLPLSGDEFIQSIGGVAMDTLSDFVDMLGTSDRALHEPRNSAAIRDILGRREASDREPTTTHEPSSADIEGTLLDNPHTAPLLGLRSAEPANAPPPAPVLPTLPPHMAANPFFTSMFRQLDFEGLRTRAHIQPGPRKAWTRPPGKTLREWVEERETELGLDSRDILLTFPAPPYANEIPTLYN